MKRPAAKIKGVNSLGRGVVAMSLAIVLLSGIAVFAGCKGGGGPTGPSGDDCASLKGGDPVGRWSDRKSPPWVMEYRPDGGYVQNDRPRGTYRVEGNKLVHTGLYPDEVETYFESAGDALTLCNTKRFQYSRY